MSMRIGGTNRGLRTAGGVVFCLFSVTLSALAQTEAVAVVKEAVGRVDVLRDSTAWALGTGDTIKPQQIIVTGPDSYAKFQVVDGSEFEVFQNSRVTFRANYSNLRDLVDVWIGTIKVHIQKLG